MTWLEDRGVVYQVNGGWAVDALVGHPTRLHGDLDVFLDAHAVPDLLRWLAGRGYAPVQDWLPVRIELAGPRGRVDVHPMRVDAQGDGVQQGLGQVVVHLAAERSSGVIAGRPVVVATAARLRQLRQGYPPRPVDRHDLGLLEQLEQELPLTGGDVTDGVVRVADTVRRPRGEHSPLVQLALQHLQRVGFAGAPRFLGVDAQDREILTFLPGEVAGRPWPAWVAEEARACSVARFARGLDDAMVPLGLPDRGPPSGGGSAGPAPPGPAPWFLGHRDLTPENLVFRDGQAAGVIDFDLLAPATRVDEVVNLLLWWGAWMPVPDRQDVMRGVDPADRGHAIVRAYGLTPTETTWVVPVARHTAERSWHRMRHRADTLGGGWARMWTDGVGDTIRRRQAWLAEHEERLTEAVRS